MAELGPGPTSVCHQTLPSHQGRLGGPSSLNARYLSLALSLSGKSQNHLSHHIWKVPVPSSVVCSPTQGSPDPITSAFTYWGSLQPGLASLLFSPSCTHIFWTGLLESAGLSSKPGLATCELEESRQVASPLRGSVSPRITIPTMNTRGICGWN